MGLGFVVGFLGLLVLFHAAYSTIQYRGLLKITEEEFSGPPLNVVIEVTLELVLCMWAALTVPGKFLSIHPHSEENSHEFKSGKSLCIYKDKTVYNIPPPYLRMTRSLWAMGIVTLPSNLDFMIFNHRYKVFPVEMDVKLKH